MLPEHAGPRPYGQRTQDKAARGGEGGGRSWRHGTAPTHRLSGAPLSTSQRDPQLPKPQKTRAASAPVNRSSNKIGAAEHQRTPRASRLLLRRQSQSVDAQSARRPVLRQHLVGETVLQHGVDVLQVCRRHRRRQLRHRLRHVAQLGVRAAQLHAVDELVRRELGSQGEGLVVGEGKERRERRRSREQVRREGKEGRASGF